MPIRGDANAQIVMDKEKDFSDWIRQEFPDDLQRFTLVEDSYKIFLGESLERDVHEELECNKGNLTQNLEMLSGFSPKFMARAWLRIIKPVVLVFGKGKIVHGDIKADNILVDLTSDGDYAFRLADWGGHCDPAHPRPPYEGTSMFQTKETLETGVPRPSDDVRALQLTFLEMYAGECLPRIAETNPDAFELVRHDGKDVSYLIQIPAKLSHNIPAPLVKVLNTPFENVSELQRTLTEVYLTLERQRRIEGQTHCGKHSRCRRLTGVFFTQKFRGIAPPFRGKTVADDCEIRILHFLEHLGRHVILAVPVLISYIFPCSCTPAGSGRSAVISISRSPSSTTRRENSRLEYGSTAAYSRLRSGVPREYQNADAACNRRFRRPLDRRCRLPARANNVPLLDETLLRQVSVDRIHE